MSASSAPSSSALASTDLQTPQHVRIVPHIETTRSLHFDVIDRDLLEGVTLKIGRFTDKTSIKDRITFKSKVVSRGHAEIWTEGGKFYIRDTMSSSGTFLNHIRLSPPNQESRPFHLKDGDVVQLGVDYQGGMEDIYRCVKMRFEINRNWQQHANPFNLSTFQTIRAFTSPTSPQMAPLTPSSPNLDVIEETSDCCICLYAIAPLQALFIAPCSHSFHYKCIRPLLQSHPGFTCPLCRTYADLEASVAIEAEEVRALWGISSTSSVCSPGGDPSLSMSMAAMHIANRIEEEEEGSGPLISTEVPPQANLPLWSEDSAAFTDALTGSHDTPNRFIAVEDLSSIIYEGFHQTQTQPVAIAASLATSGTRQLSPEEELLSLNSPSTPVTSMMMYSRATTNSLTTNSLSQAINATSASAADTFANGSQNSDDELYIVDPSRDLSTSPQPHNSPAQRTRRSSVVDRLRMAMNWDGKKVRSPSKSHRRQTSEDLNGETPLIDNPLAGPSTPNPTRGRRPSPDRYSTPPVSNDAPPTIPAASPSSVTSALTSMDDDELRDPNDIVINRSGDGKGKERATVWGLERLQAEENEAGEGRVV